MKTGDHVRYFKGKKVHLLVGGNKYRWAKCDDKYVQILGSKKGSPWFFPITDPINCKKCLKLLAKED